MSRLFLALWLMVGLSSCSGPPLKRCEGPLVETDVMYCPDQVQGPYRKCEKPKSLYRGCVSPQ